MRQSLLSFWLGKAYILLKPVGRLVILVLSVGY